MIRSLQSFLGYTLMSCDETAAGKVADICLNSRKWVVRYVVVRPHALMPWRKAIVNRFMLRHIDRKKKTLRVSQTTDEIRQSPSIETDPPFDWWVANEELNYNLAVTHWSPGSGTPGPEPPAVPKGGPKLFGLRHLLDYKVTINNGQMMGDLVDFLVDEKTARISAVTVNLHEGNVHKRVAVGIENVRAVQYVERIIALDLNRAGLLSAPPYGGTPRKRFGLVQQPLGSA